VSEVLFSGLEAQSEISRLLDELYDDLEAPAEMKEEIVGAMPCYDWGESEHEGVDTDRFMLEPEPVYT
jgi:hypothetical protein